jgi:hypothetical protein
MRKGLSSKDIELEMHNRRAFIDFLGGLLRLNPLERWTPLQALQHPFITQKPFTEPFNPLTTLTSPKVDTLRQESSPQPIQLSPRSSQLRRKNQYSNLKDPLPYQNMMGVMPSTSIEAGGGNLSQSGMYNQVVGTFSEFHIHSTSSMPIGSMPEPSFMSKSHEFGNSAYNNSSSSFAPQSLASSSQAFPIRKAKSHYSVADAYGQGHAKSLHGFSSTPGLHNAFLAGEYEGHPRHGDQGERQRIPSRLPSAAPSVDWEIFRDYEGGSLPSSYAGSRQSSFIEGGMNFGSVDRRPSQHLASPGQQRHLQFQSRRVGSFSNESFVNESDQYSFLPKNSLQGKSAESLRGSFQDFGSQPVSPNFGSLSGSPRQSRYGKTHKKVKSTSSFPFHQDSSDVSNRRPSVPNAFYPPQLSNNFGGMQAGLHEHQYPQERRPSLLDLNSSHFLPPSGGGSYVMNKGPLTNMMDHTYSNSELRPEGSMSASKPIDLPKTKHRSREMSPDLE